MNVRVSGSQNIMSFLIMAAVGVKGLTTRITTAAKGEILKNQKSTELLQGDRVALRISVK